MIKRLDPRLQAVADAVRAGRPIADIGTDHAYIPIYLVENNITPTAIACDVRQGPLESARSNIAESQLSDKISVRLGDGLSPVNEGEAEDVVIAGMGGELIARIISECTWAKSEHLHFVLQPMSCENQLREYLCQNGFNILSETAVESASHVYTVISVMYDGIVRECSDSFLYAGKLLTDNSPAALAYKEKLCRRLQKKAEGLYKSGDEAGSAAQLNIINKIKRGEM